MHAAPFEYHDPTSLDEVRRLLDRRGPRPALLAGGQSLLPALVARSSEPAALVDLGRIAPLRAIETTADGELEIGAMARYVDLQRSPLVRSAAPLLAAAAGLVGMRAVRTRGTIGGCLAFADPRAELPLALTVLGADVTVSTAEGEWRGPLDDWRPVARRREGDLLLRIHVPPAGPRDASAIRETAPLGRGFATAVVAVRLTGDEHGAIVGATVAAGAVAPTPIELPQVAAALRGRPLADPLGSEAAAVLEAELSALDPPSDLHAGGEHRRHVTTVLARRAIAAAARELRPEGT
ncbi:MAG: FAD binding domain-containing protein [Patulibacter sp.]